MMGDRYGELVKVDKLRGAMSRRFANQVRASLLTADRHANHNGAGLDIAVVRLDRSGKTVRVWLHDCQVL